MPNANKEAVKMLDRLANAGPGGLGWRDASAASSTAMLFGYEYIWFRTVLAAARRLAASRGQVIPRPHDGVHYRLTDVIGPLDGTYGARAGIIVALGDTLTRQRTQVSTLAVLRSNQTVPPHIRARITRAHTMAAGEAARLEDLIDAVRSLPNGTP